MKTRSGQKIKLTSVEELLGVPNEEVASEGCPQLLPKEYSKMDEGDSE